jgi:flavin reductase (DIM6/NTAB) family NADH-FMN oxidoreductase RutF
MTSNHDQPSARLIDPTEFRRAIAKFATGVTVITTDGASGPAGMTASAVCSLSIEPVRLLVCISTHLPTHEALEQTKTFAVNVLGEGQEHLARRFARPAEDKFAGVDLVASGGPPVLKDSIAHFLCRVAERFPGGDHSIFIGDVYDFGSNSDAKPLLYFGSTFGAMSSAEDSILRTWWDRPDLS